MSHLPEWSLRQAEVDDRMRAKQAFSKNHCIMEFAEGARIRKWMRENDWKHPWIRLMPSFKRQLFENDEKFTQALTKKLVKIFIPKEEYQIPQEYLDEITSDYNDGNYDTVVTGLQDIRRAIDAGVCMHIHDQPFTSSAAFYNWVHEQYPKLEEGSDKWVLMDA